MKKIALTVLLAGSLLAGTGSIAQAEQTAVSTEVYFVPVDFVFDGTELTPPEGQKGFIYEGSTYVPLRFISYALGKSVQWENSSYTVSLSEPNEADKVTIEQYKLNQRVQAGQTGSNTPSQIVPSTIAAYFENITYVFDGKQIQPSQELPGFIYQDVLYVPLRFVSESLGKNIGWNQDTYTVSVKTTSAEPNGPATTNNEEPGSLPAQPAPNAPATGGGGGGGKSTSKPSYDSLIKEAETKLNNLKSSAETSFNNLLDQYLAAEDQSTKDSLLIKGLGELAQFNSSFDKIVNDLESKLSDNGYSTDVIATYRAQYEKEKAQKKAELLSALN